MRSLSSILLITLTVASLAENILKAEGPDPAALKGFISGIREEVRKSNGKIYLSGTVRDGEGNLLDDVKVRGTVTKQTGFWDSSKDKKVSRTISGNFSLLFKDCSSVALRFKKNGYRRSSINVMAREGKGTPPVLKKENLEIVLYRRWEGPHLKEYSGVLEYKADGSGTVIVIEPNKDPRKHKPTRKLTNVTDAEALPNRSVFMIPSTTEDGTVDIVKIGELEIVKMGSVDKHTRDINYPKKVRIVMKAAEGGFIKFDPVANIPVEVQMSEAPKEGYNKEMVLTAGKMDSMTSKTVQTIRHGQDVYGWFYFRMNGRYGRGRFIHPYRRNRSKRSEHLRLGVELHLQPNGTRRVGPYMNPGN